MNPFLLRNTTAFKKNKPKERGFNLVEVIVGTLLIVIILWGIVGIFQFTIKVVTQSKLRATAIFLANQKIEQIRSLSYGNIGTVGGIPPGIIPETETKSYNNADFTVKTTIIYIDDPSDGLAPDDTVPTDYKRAEVKVSWEGGSKGEVVFVTDISPKNIETDQEGGILVINVVDADGVGVSQAEVHIVNDQVDPVIDATYLTDSDGKLTLTGVPPSIESYQISVTKTGYSLDRTYGRDEVANPLKPHASVFEDEITEISFSIDRLGTMDVQTTGTQGNGYPPIGLVTFTLQGNKIIGTDAEGQPVYKFTQSYQTDQTGRIEITDLEWDSYYFTIESPEGLDLAEVESPPGEPTTLPIDLLPAETKEIRLILDAQNSCLVKVLDSSTSQPIFSASVRLYNLDLGYDTTQPTDSNGESFFIPLEEATYNLEVQMEGYQPYYGTVYVVGDVAKTVLLSQ